MKGFLPVLFPFRAYPIPVCPCTEIYFTDAADRTDKSTITGIIECERGLEKKNGVGVDSLQQIKTDKAIITVYIIKFKRRERFNYSSATGKNKRQ